jgi:ParB family chromosome partitioning protein
VEYELIAGERRLRASKLAGLPQVPVIIRASQDDDKMKLELAIIENLQREDLNPIDRAQAFLRLHEEFKLTHGDIGKKMGKSREYVSNTLRLLTLPEEIRNALGERKISEGHTRPLMMLSDRPMEQLTLFKEMVIKKLSVRESEKIARGIATDKVRKKDFNFDPTIASYQEKLSESLGTRVSIEKKEVGGKIVIDYFSPNDLQTILELLKSNESKGVGHMMEGYINNQGEQNGPETLMPEVRPEELESPQPHPDPLLQGEGAEPEMQTAQALDDRTGAEVEEEENTDLYNMNNFTI